MDDRISVVLGIAAGLVTVADTVPYVRDTIRGTTRPHRGTWAIWTALAVLGAARGPGAPPSRENQGAVRGSAPLRSA